MVHVHLLGTFAVQNERRSLHPALGSDGRRLAAYLFSFPNRSHRRDRLLDLFWPEADPIRARAAFSTALWKVRKLVQGEKRTKINLVTTAQDVCLDLSDLSVVDAHQFRAAALEAFSAIYLASNCGALVRAADLYRGPFLEEYDEDWVLEQREKLQALYIRSLADLMCLLAQRTEYDDALLCGRRLLASDPTRETIHRAVMVLYVLNGQRAEALRQYERCERVLNIECAVEPVPETRSLVRLIRSDDIFGRLSELADAMFAIQMRNPLLISSLKDS